MLLKCIAQSKRNFSAIHDSIRAQIKGEEQCCGGKYYVKQRKHTKKYSFEEAGRSHHDSKMQVFESGTHQGSPGEGMQLEHFLEHLKAEYINIAEFLIRRGGVTEVTSEHGDSRFC